MSLFGGDKEKIAQAIYYAEIIADEDSRSVGAILLQNAEDIKKIDPKEIEFSQKLKIIANKIIKGDKIEKIYAEYLDPEMLYFMSEATDSGVSRSEVISKYLPLKKIAHSTSSKIKNKLKVPIFISLISILFMGYVLDDFAKMMEDGIVEADFSTAMWIADNYYFLSFGILLLIGIPLIFFPQKLPKIKGLFRKINAMMSILMIAILNKIGQSPVHIIPFLIKTFKIKGFYPKNNDLDDIAKVLYHAKFINFFQASRIMGITSVKRDFPIVLDGLLEELRLEVELSSELIEEVIGMFTTLIVLIPITPALYVIGKIIGTLVTQAFQSM